MENKHILAILALVLIGTYFSYSHSRSSFIQTSETIPSLEDIFQEWAQSYGKRYTTEETAHRFEVFSSNYQLIRAHNSQQNNTYTMGLNKFSDLSNKEFEELYLTKSKFNNGAYKTKYLNVSNSADSVDWRNKGAVTEIKDQASCGSCWAFSAVAAIESVYAISKGSQKLFSEQQLVDCSEGGNMGCNGGEMTYSFDYVQENGIELSSDYKYTARDGTCKYNASKVAFKISSWNSIPSKNTAQFVAAVNQQPISVGVNANTFQSYSKGILSGTCGTSLNHGVVMVGYGTEGSKDFWIVKNSWGNSWGENGYIRVLKTSGTGAGQCGITLEGEYPNA